MSHIAHDIAEISQYYNISSTLQYYCDISAISRAI